MARAIWSGAISFGLVNVPVKLYNAVSHKDVRFNMLTADGERVQQKLVGASSGEEVSRTDTVKGYELSKGRYVVITPEELEAATPANSKSIAIEEFVELAEIDPVLYDASYHAAPEKGAARPYSLLRESMFDAGRVGIGRFMLRSRESLAAVRATDRGLIVATLAYADELVPVDTIPEIVELADDDKYRPSDKERKMAMLLIDSLTVPLDLAEYRDTYRVAVLDMIERKAAGEVVEAPAPATAAEPVGDIMAALEASLAAAKERRAAAAAR